MTIRNVVVSFVISAAALALQFTLTRILSVLYWQHLVYAILTTSLLGFAASGTALQLSSRLRALDTTAFIRFTCAGFALSSVMAVAGVCWLAGDFFSLSVSSLGAGNVLRLAVSYLVSSLPFFFFGLLILGLFRRHPNHSGPLYAANLLGSGAGSLLFLAGIRPLGAIGLVVGGVFVPSALVAIFPGKERKSLSPALAGLILGALALSALITIIPDRHKQFWILSPTRTVEFTEWNPISRVDVIRAGLGLQRHILIDGDAQAALSPPADRVEREVRYRWDATGSADISFVTKGWSEIGVLLELRLPGKEPARDFVVHLVTGGLKYSQKISAPTGRVVPIFVSWRDGDQLGRTSVDFSPFTISQWPPIAIGERAEILLQDSGGEAFTGTIRRGRIWKKALDRGELLSLSPAGTGYERLIGHELHRVATGRPEAHVLVIGNGGGADSVAAVAAGARRVTAVEVNPTSYALTRDYYRDYLGDFFRRDDVNLVLGDGRSFVRRSRDRYDLITLVGVDSFAAASSGAYVLAESFLYTTEALSDYWDHLSPDGRIQISRWHFPKAPRETFRVFTMAYEMLAKRGIEHPERHLTVVSQYDTEQSSGRFATLLMSKAPLSASSLELLQQGFAGYKFNIIFHPLQDALSAPNPFHSFLLASRDAHADDFYRDYAYNVRPVSDDNPFFFQYGKFSHLLRPYPIAAEGFDSVLGRWPFFILLLLLVQCVIGGFCVVVPVWRRLRPPGSFVSTGVPYFASLGVAFMFVEMYLIQKLVLVLGHPMYSLGVTLPALLGSAALGSFLTRRLDLGRRATRRWLFGTIALLLAGFTFAVPPLLDWALPLGFPGRSIFCVGLILPVGIALGIPFPAGIRMVSPTLLPLAWAVNGALTVLASVVAVLVAMTGGFSSLVAVAAVLYAWAAWLVPHPSGETSEVRIGTFISERETMGGVPV